MIKIDFKNNNWIFKLSILLILIYVNIALYFLIFKLDENSTLLNKFLMYLGFNVLTILYLFIPFIISVFVDIITKGVITYKWCFVAINFSTIAIVLLIVLVNLFFIKPKKEVNTKWIEDGTFSSEEELVIKKQLITINNSFKTDEIVYKAFSIKTERENSDSDIIIINSYKMATAFFFIKNDSINSKLSIVKYNSDFKLIKDSVINIKDFKNFDIEKILPSGKVRMYEN